MRFLLMPFALIAAVLFVMGLHIIGTALHHQAAWHQTIAAVTDVDPYSEMQENGLATEGINVAVTYVANDLPMSWSGKGKLIGLYKASKGDKVELYYDPADASNVDTAATKGWRGGLLLLAVTGGSSPSTSGSSGCAKHAGDAAYDAIARSRCIPEILTESRLRGFAA